MQISQKEELTKNYKEMNWMHCRDLIKHRNLTNYNIQKTKSMNDQLQRALSSRETISSSSSVLLKFILIKRDIHARTLSAANHLWEEVQTIISIMIPSSAPLRLITVGDVQAQGEVAALHGTTLLLLQCEELCPTWMDAQH